MPAIHRWSGSLLGVLAAACLAAEEASSDRALPCEASGFPPTETTPRDPEQAAELWNLLEQADPLPVQYPQLWTQMRAAQRELPLAEVDQGNPQALQAVICALWTDYGSPALNEANQWFLAGVIADGAERVAATADRSTRRALAEALLHYLDAGGAAVQPAIPALIGRSLARLMPDDAEIRSLAEQLVTDAVQWELEISALRGDAPSREVLRCGTDVLGPAFALQAYEMLEGSPPGPQPACYRLACIAMAAVLDEFGQVRTAPSATLPRQIAGRLDAASRIVLRRCGPVATQEDLQCRLAVVMRTLLRSQRPPADRRILRQINRTLLELLRRDALAGPRAWRRWADAVLALRASRISDELAAELLRRLSHARADHPLDEDTRDRLIRLAQRHARRRRSEAPKQALRAVGPSADHTRPPAPSDPPQRR